MRKDVLAAIVIGVSLGAVVAFGIWRAKSYLSPKQISPISAQQTTLPTPQDQAQANSDLVITQPEDNTVTNSDKVTIKGSAIPKSTVVIVSNSDEAIVEADQYGSFEQEIALDGGPNEINVTSYDDQGNESAQELTVVYSTEVGQ
ncbi:MAG: hypothetical protein A3D24_01125 [Candidatus Blackburnbacteria bacterium RIFCSPHIGHO2_02_FULL_39_13]|uniref:Uncharacterized protein n=1 Tax=Candidatus Blackburnbacteria bacterium RIFCSPLOWO2_01_FULL_40_20 TaxID=1797519 RepID=A0A1G1VFK3_9BACT|nr:MAG: hypothetical protein UT38_C0021G0009 [Microgenomates group bacterium GW2011_GWA2_39_19]OGY07302.1 MAG: hypothetical protein A2694_04305 [Candidatus Blackburnbacteria bacterium RIFCSPHIGHO2_01_FULL_40_17]OGY08062.1 MAG: hypothetical protein A3D24_01125 [Candidatus Blackburnbacteria bacterium RIFCSPHIGHO2_02_FULL_39_13]OGY14151.1 MAG: hypothetical protein A3A77_04805 [Candidatus Blackburnbacteria bacterium RIFCSPLOWO2_01_FULL_40_20]OGY15447.1 MAG: hypothetical protein A3I52_01930 [Candida